MDHNEHESLVNELAKGKKLAEERAGHLGGTSSSNIEDRLVERILASYDEALNLLTRPEPQGQSQGQCQSVISSASDTSIPSVSVCNDTPPKDSSIGPLKRKSVDELQNFVTKMHQGILQKVSASILQRVSDTSSSVLNVTPSKESRRSRQDVQTVVTDKSQKTTLDDEYPWRKYGQKDIVGSRYPSQDRDGKLLKSHMNRQHLREKWLKPKPNYIRRFGHKLKEQFQDFIFCSSPLSCSSFKRRTGTQIGVERPVL